MRKQHTPTKAAPPLDEPDDQGERVYTVPQLAARWQCVQHTILAAIRAGKLQAFRINKRVWRVREAEVVRFEQQQQAYKRARALQREMMELQREAMESIDAAWYVDRFIALADAARAKGEHAQAARIISWMMDRTGHSAPAKLAIAARVQASVAPGSEPPHMKLLDETPAQRRQRMADLKARRALPAPVDASIEASVTVVPQAQDGDPREDDGET